MIRKLSNTDKARAVEIWKTCFGDSDAFIDAYFNSAAHIGDSFGYEENGSLIADLFMLKFHAKLAGTEYDIDFLAGCATMPEARKRGLMRDLVKRAMLDMRARGLLCVYLHPFLHAFYRQFGFETIAYVTRHTLSGDAEQKPLVTVYDSLDDLPVEKMYDAYARYMESFDNCFLRTHERFAAWLRLLFADGGKAAVRDGDDFAYALYFAEAKAADVFELVPGAMPQETLLKGIDAPRVDYLMPSLREAPNSEEFTMMRALDPVRLLENAKPVDQETVLLLTDEFLGEEYRLLLSGGGRGNRVCDTDGTADIEVSAAELAALLAGTAEHALFGKQTACFFETY